MSNPFSQRAKEFGMQQASPNAHERKISFDLPPPPAGYVGSVAEHAAATAPVAVLQYSPHAHLDAMPPPPPSAVDASSASSPQTPIAEISPNFKPPPGMTGPPPPGVAKSSKKTVVTPVAAKDVPAPKPVVVNMTGGASIVSPNGSATPSRITTPSPGPTQTPSPMPVLSTKSVSVPVPMMANSGLASPPAPKSNVSFAQTAPPTPTTAASFSAGPVSAPNSTTNGNGAGRSSVMNDISSRLAAGLKMHTPATIASANSVVAASFNDAPPPPPPSDSPVLAPLAPPSSSPAKPAGQWPPGPPTSAPGLSRPNSLGVGADGRAASPPTTGQVWPPPPNYNAVGSPVLSRPTSLAATTTAAKPQGSPIGSPVQMSLNARSATLPQPVPAMNAQPMYITNQPQAGQGQVVKPFSPVLGQLGGGQPQGMLPVNGMMGMQQRAGSVFMPPPPPSSDLIPPPPPPSDDAPPPPPPADTLFTDMPPTPKSQQYGSSQPPLPQVPQMYIGAPQMGAGGGMNPLTMNATAAGGQVPFNPALAANRPGMLTVSSPNASAATSRVASPAPFPAVVTRPTYATPSAIQAGHAGLQPVGQQQPMQQQQPQLNPFQQQAMQFQQPKASPQAQFQPQQQQQQFQQPKPFQPQTSVQTMQYAPPPSAQELQQQQYQQQQQMQQQKQMYQQQQQAFRQPSPAPVAIVQPSTYCIGCSLAITGQVLELSDGRTYHPHCYKCTHCQQPITEGILMVQEKPYHSSCVMCDTCGINLANAPFAVKQGKIFCATHARQQQQQQQQTPTMGNGGGSGRQSVSASPLGGPFGSNRQQQQAPPQQQYQPPQQLAPVGDVCSGCGLPTTAGGGPLISAGDNAMYHERCLVCCACNCQLNMSASVYNQNGKLYCENDYLRIFAQQCAGCGVIIKDGSCISVGIGGDEKLSYHTSCFSCADCQSTLAGSGFFLKPGTRSLVCQRCA